MATRGPDAPGGQAARSGDQALAAADPQTTHRHHMSFLKFPPDQYGLLPGSAPRRGGQGRRIQAMLRVGG